MPGRVERPYVDPRIRTMPGTGEGVWGVLSPSLGGVVGGLEGSGEGGVWRVNSPSLGGEGGGGKEGAGMVCDLAKLRGSRGGGGGGRTHVLLALVL